VNWQGILDRTIAMLTDNNDANKPELAQASPRSPLELIELQII
jgi:hypothetical protein